MDKQIQFLKMSSPISIHKSNQTVQLSMGTYSVKVLGGWGVKVGNFTFELRNLKNNRIIQPKGTQWRIQSFAFKKRAKKIFSVDIPEKGEYSIKFKNLNELKVRRSNLFMTKLFDKPIPNKDLEICIG